MFSHSDNLQGVQAFQQGNVDLAMARFQNAIETDPYHADPYYNLAAAYHRVWKVRGEAYHGAQSESFYHQALVRDREHREAYRGLAVLYVEQGKRDQAVQLLTDWSAQSTAPANAKVELARLYQELGEPEIARQRLHEALEIDPRHGDALAGLAMLQELSGQYEQAYRNYSRSFDISQNPQIAQRMASLQGTAGSMPTSGTPGGPRLVTLPDRLPRY
jgi:tetratricopeptide (TPR) repeat protein